MITRDELYPAGKFQRTHALKGELNMILDLDPEYFLEGNPLIVDYDGIYVPYYIESIRKKGATSFLVKIQGVDSEAEASSFVNKEVFINKNNAEEWLEEELIEQDALVGYKVIDKSSGKEIGEIETVDDTTANLLFIIQTNEGDEIIIPANEDFISHIDDEKKTIEMLLPDGLLDINIKDK